MPNPTSDPNGPSPSSPSGRLTIPAPRFLPPPDEPAASSSTPAETPTSDPSPSPSPETAPAATDPGSWDEWPEPEPPAADEPSRPRRTGASRASSLADRRALEDAAAAVVTTVTNLLHERTAATDPAATALGVWLADEQDLDGISKPAASLVARRSGDMLGAGNPDLADVIGLGIAVAGYLVKQVGKLAALRRFHRSTAGGLMPAEPEHEQAEA